MTLLKAGDRMGNYEDVVAEIPPWFLRYASLAFGCSEFLTKDGACDLCDCGADDGAPPDMQSVLSADFAARLIMPLVKQLENLHVPACNEDATESWCSYCVHDETWESEWPCQTAKLLNAYLNWPIPDPVPVGRS